MPIRAESARGRGRGTALFRVLWYAALLLVALGGCTMKPAPSSGSSLGSMGISAPAPGAVDLVRRALSEGRHGDAKILLDRLLLAEPENLEAHLALAELRLARGLPRQAVRSFTPLTEAPEVRSRALQGRGIALLLLGERNAGSASLRQATEQDPTLWRAWNALGSYYDSQGDWDQAARSYGSALAAKPESALVYNNRGFSRLLQGRAEEVVDDLNRSLRIDPTLELAQANLRLALAWRGQYLSALSGAPESQIGKILNNICFIAILRGDYGSAEAFLLRAMELAPSFNAVASRNVVYLEGVKRLRGDLGPSEWSRPHPGWPMAPSASIPCC